MEEIFEVIANEDIEDMNICDFIQDTSPTPTTPRKPSVTFAILTTLLVSFFFGTFFTQWKDVYFLYREIEKES